MTTRQPVSLSGRSRGPGRDRQLCTDLANCCGGKVHTCGMSVESGKTKGARPPVIKSPEDVPPGILIFPCLFFLIRIKILHFQHFQN